MKIFICFLYIMGSLVSLGGKAGAMSRLVLDGSNPDVLRMLPEWLPFPDRILKTVIDYYVEPEEQEGPLVSNFIKGHPLDQKQLNMRLAFPYHPVKQGQRIKYIHQKAVGMLTETDDFMVIGPLKPCIGIVLYYEGQILGVHKDNSSDIQSLAEFYRLLHVTDPAKIIGTLYTAELSSEEWERDWKSVYEGRSQIQEVRKTKQFLTNTFGIPSPNIRAILYRLDKPSSFYGNYFDAFTNLLVNKKGDVFNTSFYTEDIMGLRGSKLPEFDYEVSNPGFFSITFLKQIETFKAHFRNYEYQAIQKDLKNIMKQNRKLRKELNKSKTSNYGMIPLSFSSQLIIKCR